MSTDPRIDKAISELRSVMAFKQMSLRTEKAYAYWVRRYSGWLIGHPTGTSAENMIMILLDTNGCGDGQLQNYRP